MKLIRIGADILVLAGAVSFILSLIAKVINIALFGINPNIYLSFANACFIFAVALFVYQMAEAKRPKAAAKKPAKKKTARKR